MTDYVIAGLGNPGAEHANQRHNVGFWVIDHLAKRHGIALNAGPNAHTGQGSIGDTSVVLVKPRTYVNNSGKAIGPLMRKDGVPAEHLLIVYDELDLPEGRIRLRPKGGPGGHNGLKSIIGAVGSGDFGRVRVGIGRPHDHHGVPTWDPEIVVKWVLAPPPRDAAQLWDETVERACDAIEVIIAQGWERAMDTFNRA